MFDRKSFYSFATLTLTVATFLLMLTGSSFGQHYTRTDLTADMTSTSMSAANHDPNLVNAWGLTRSSTSPWWVADNGTGLSTLYNGVGAPQQLVVKIPTPDGTGTAAPTGTVFNFTSKGFEVKPGFPAVFLFVTEDGTIAGWNPKADPNALIVKNRAGKAVYKGCALAQTKKGTFLYATNFQTGRVEVFDSGFNLVRTQDLDFNGDNRGGSQFVPFNIQNVGGNLVVTFAKRQSGSKDEQHGPGLGVVAIFDSNLRLLNRLDRGNFLNAPWGVALSPSDFGAFSHRLLIGNFGDGTINAFNATTGKFEGKLLNADGSTLTIDGLWSIAFGGGNTNSGSATEMFFTAGPNDENNGLFGKVAAVATEQRGSVE